MNGLDALATAIMWHEGEPGFRPGARSFKNCNPGNLRTASAPAHDAGGFAVWPDLIAGYEALWDDLADKFTGNNSHGLGPDSNLADFFNVYAPAGDQNDPQSYAQFAAAWIGVATGKATTITSRLKDIWQPPQATIPAPETA